MITLANPVTVATSTQTFSELPYILLDDQQKKIVQVRFKGIPNPLIIWQGAAYDSAGDYTQAQVDSTIMGLLGSNPSAALSALFHPPARTVPPTKPAIAPVATPSATPAPSTPAASSPPSA